jgi:hypothetical protein
MDCYADTGNTQTVGPPNYIGCYEWLNDSSSLVFPRILYQLASA